MIFYEKKAKYLADLIVQKSKGTVRYEVALDYSRRLYKSMPFYFGWFTDVGPNSISNEISKRLAGK